MCSLSIVTNVSMRFARLEASAFHGAEPDEERWDLDGGKLDSESVRLVLTPIRSLSAQVSFGYLTTTITVSDRSAAAADEKMRAVERVVREPAGGAAEPLEVPRRVAVRAEEVAPHVVVDPVDDPAAGIEVGHRLRADEAAAAGDEDRARSRHAREPPLAPPTSPNARSSPSICANPSLAGAVRDHSSSSTRLASQSTRGAKPVAARMRRASARQ